MGTVNTPSNKSLARLTLCLLVCAAGNADAGDWRLTPTISVSERYSDNIGLSAGASSESSFITDIAPGLSIRRQGGRAQLEADYSLHGLLYSHDGGANNFQHQLTARLRAEPVSERFFLDADARIDQSTVSTVDRVGGSYNLGGSHVETRSLGITPILRKRFGAQAIAEARWELRLTNADGGVISNTRSDNLTLTLASGRAFNNVPWALKLTRQNSDSGGTDSEIRGISGYVGYRLSPKFELGINAGHEDTSGTTQFNEVGGAYGNLAMRWSPSIRTSLGASLGRRYDGSSYGLDFSHRTARSTWALRYAESISEPSDLLLSFDQYLCPNASGALLPTNFYAGSQAPANCILIGRADLSAQLLGLISGPSLNKTWSGTVSYRFSKSTFSLSLNSNRRHFLSGAGGSDDVANLSAIWNWRIGPRTTSTLSLTHGSTEYYTLTGDSDFTTLSWALSRKLAARTMGNLEIGHLKKTGGTSGDYDENTISARITHSF